MKRDWTSAEIPDLSRKVCIVTGASSGLGVEIRKQLEKHGGHTIMAVRNVQKGELVRESIATEIGGKGNLEVMKLDLSNFASVSAFAEEFRAKFKQVDILSCNAGVMALEPLQKTADGHEMQWATNHLGHFLLVKELWDLIKASTSCRITIQSSFFERKGSFNWDNLDAEKTYDRWDQHAMTKLANLTFANELARRVQEAGLKYPLVNSCHPGYVRTQLQDNADLGLLMSTALMIFNPPKGTPETDAHPMLYGLTDPEAEPAAFYGPTGFMSAGGKNPKIAKPQKLATDLFSMKKLWEVSEETLNIKFEV